ncbi:transposase [Streptomyces collinus Tu 365]|uniref:Transposase n=1 Tax=Streptomyces collinus (strain DSM 40733 / Tue 365) TaxID=1214242 RepID=S5VGN6_STRC3|nr:transposase [Streptomyces collinus Tu 365]
MSGASSARPATSPISSSSEVLGSPPAFVSGRYPRARKRPPPARLLHTGPSSVDRGRSGSQHHLITDGHGTTLAALLAGGNRNEHVIAVRETGRSGAPHTCPAVPAHPTPGRSCRRSTPGSRPPRR